MIIDNKDLEYKAFLKELYVQQERTVYTSILILDKEENVIRDIRGEVTAGSISVDGNSSVRRSGSLTFVATAEENDLTNIENDLSMNKKIKVLIGLKNNINKNFSDIIWFNQGIFIISQPNISHNLTGVTISLSLKDKMCLLNGTFGGVFPAPVTFSEYTQYYVECEFEGIDPEKAIKNKEGDIQYTLKGNWKNTIDLYDNQGRKIKTIFEAAKTRGEEEYYFSDFDIQLNYITEEMKKKLPCTDSRLRPDLRALENQDYELAKSEKLRLEIEQRKRKKEMDENGTQYTPYYFDEVYDDITGELVYTYKRDYWKDREVGDWKHLKTIY